MNIYKFGYILKERKILGRDGSSLLPLDIDALDMISWTTTVVPLKNASPHTEGSKEEFWKDLIPGWHQRTTELSNPEKHCAWNSYFVR